MSILHGCRGVYLTVLFLAGATVGRSQGVTNLGSEFSVIGSRPGDQVLPSIALTATGGVLAFYNQGLGINGAVLGGSYTAGSIYAVQKTATGDQVRPSVKVLRNGNTIYVWQSRVLGTPDIFARLGKGPNFYTGDIRVNTYLKDQQVEPAAAALADGGAMVVWASYGQDGSLWGVYARKVTAAGALAGTQEFLVNQYTIGNQRKPRRVRPGQRRCRFRLGVGGGAFCGEPGYLCAGLYGRRGAGHGRNSGQFRHV